MKLSRLFWRSLVADWLGLFVLVLCVCFITSLTARAGEPPAYGGPVAALNVTPPKYSAPEPVKPFVALPGVTKQSVPGCGCTGGKVCECGPGCDCVSNTVAPAPAPANEVWTQQWVCTGERCELVWVKATSAPAQNYTTVTASACGSCSSCGPQASYGAPVTYGSCASAAPVRGGFHPFQNLRERIQERRQTRGGFFAGGGCASCR